MCVISMIHDDWNERNKGKINPYLPAPNTTIYTINTVTKEEFTAFKEEMRKELKALRKLLVAAREYDKETGQEDCVDEKKLELVRKVCELVGLDPDEILA